MCDCYAHKCECCEELIQMHIADFKFPRSNFMVWCEKHIYEAPPGAIIFEVVEADDDFYDDFDLFPVGWKCAILGPNVGCEGEGNCPNIGEKMKCTEVKG